MYIFNIDIYIYICVCVCACAGMMQGTAMQSLISGNQAWPARKSTCSMISCDVPMIFHGGFSHFNVRKNGCIKTSHELQAVKIFWIWKLLCLLGCYILVPFVQDSLELYLGFTFEAMPAAAWRAQKNVSIFRGLFLGRLYRNIIQQMLWYNHDMYDLYIKYMLNYVYIYICVCVCVCV